MIYFNESQIRNKRFLVPGTLWCGVGKLNVEESLLGFFRETDSCCRQHELCPRDKFSAIATSTTTTEHKPPDEYYTTPGSYNTEFQQPVTQSPYSSTPRPSPSPRPESTSTYNPDQPTPPPVSQPPQPPQPTQSPSP
ncbi:hypothetical protein PV325_009030, partial [Microctonus aethiopoides]